MAAGAALTSPMSAPVIRAEGLIHRYGARRALDGVDLSVTSGEMVGLIGPDGVGKSTMLGLIAGVRALQDGRLDVLGGAIADPRHRRAACARIAYMPQGLGGNLYKDLSVVENIGFFGRLFGIGRKGIRERTEQLLVATDLLRFADRRMGDLSGGMKQKLGLCCALIHDPELLILDEPTTGVDPLSRRSFWTLIDTLRRRPAGQAAMTVLVATGYLDEAEAFDRIVMMDEGRIIADGTPGALEAAHGVDSLERAFVAALPPERRGDAEPFRVPAPRPGTGPPAIEAHELTRRFGAFVAVEKVDFTIPQGEIFGFLGPNGCGKTTTMKMLTGLLPATSGAARLFGAPVGAPGTDVRRRIGYMSQAFSLYSELSVAENLRLHAELYDLGTSASARIAELGARFGLTALADRRADALPLGVRQRLALAVAVIHRPDVLILDEPTSGVDPVARDGFWRLIVELSREQGVTVFVSTHYMNEAERCDRIAFMNAGRLLAVGTPADLVRAVGADGIEGAFMAVIEADMARRAA